MDKVFLDTNVVVDLASQDIGRKFLGLLRHADKGCRQSVAKRRGCRNNLGVFLWKKLEGNESRRIFASSIRDKYMFNN